MTSLLIAPMVQAPPRSVPFETIRDERIAQDERDPFGEEHRSRVASAVFTEGERSAIDAWRLRKRGSASMG